LSLTNGIRKPCYISKIKLFNFATVFGGTTNLANKHSSIVKIAVELMGIGNKLNLNWKDLKKR